MITLDNYGTLVAASLVLLTGRRLAGSVPLLRAYSIPEPVIGGLIVALGLYAAKSLFDFEVRFDSTQNTPLMLSFFASIGLNADLASLKRGGRPLLLLLAVVVGFLVTQNIFGVLMANLLGFPPLMGLLAGSIALSGGHGTGVAWGTVFSDKYGLTSATEVAMACATFGLVLGGIIGGPVARYLARKTHGESTASAEAPGAFEDPGTNRKITAPAMIETLALFAVCLMVGKELFRALQGSFLELPSFVCVLFVGVVLRNTLARFGGYEVFERCVSVLGNVSLALMCIRDRAKTDLERYQRLFEGEQAVAKSEVDDRKSRLEVARTNLAAVEQELSDTVIRAPFDGVLVRRRLETFTNVQAKQVIADVQDLGRLEVVINVPERTFRQHKPERDALALFSGQKDRPVKLRLKSYAIDADPQTQSYEVVLGIGEIPSGMVVLPGMSASVAPFANPMEKTGTSAPVSSEVWTR